MEVTFRMTKMRSNFLLQTRNCLRSPAFLRSRSSYSAVRWSSSEARQWSTPLAKQLSEAITVPQTSERPQPNTNLSPGYGTNSTRLIHANVLDIRPRRLLHFQTGRAGPIWTKGRFHYLTGDITNIWGIDRYLVRSRMDGTRSKE